MGARIAAVGYHLPERVETCEDLARENPGWDAAKIAAKLGIRSRHIAADDETASDLGYHAARKVLDQSGTDAAAVDFTIFCTQSPDYPLPTTACALQHRLGLRKDSGALDVNQACSGYVYGLCLAKSLIAGGVARTVLVVTAETYSKYLGPADLSVRPLFGDGAAATLVVAAEEDAVGHFVLGTDGAGAERLIVRAGGCRQPRRPAEGAEPRLYMDGPAIFTFASATVPELVNRVLDRAGWEKGAVDWYVYHQANSFMLTHLAVKSGISRERMVLCMEDVGNTVSASIPIAIARYVEAGKIRPGQRLVLVGFGAGYSWGACTVTWAGQNERGRT